MESYPTEFLRNMCKSNQIPHSRLTKKQMYDILLEKDIIVEDRRGKEPKKEKREKIYLGEEYRNARQSEE